MSFPPLPPYTIEPADDDLWSCGRRLSGEDVAPSKPNSYEVHDLVMQALYGCGPEGVPTKAELARLADVKLNQVSTVLTNEGVMYRERRFVHPAFTSKRPWPFRPQRAFTW